MKRVAVLRGGPSEEYDVSMNTGSTVLAALKATGYATKDIVITRKGDWLADGQTRKPESALEAIDAVFIALHGAYGEDGQVQRILQRKNIPFTGSRAMPSAMAFNKVATKQILLTHGVQMPKHVVLKGESLWSVKSRINDLYNALGTDIFLKPLNSGSSVGAVFVDNQDALEVALEGLLNTYGEVLAEEYIKGREATVGVLQDYRNERHYTLPAVEIIPPQDATFFDKEVKYNGRTTELCPGSFDYEEKQKLAELAVLAHTAIGCEHYSRSDFLLKDGKIYFLEINTLPGLTEQSLFPKAAKAVGLEFNDLVKHLIDTATA